MSLQGSRNVVIDISQKLASLPPKFPTHRIRKVNEPLRNKNPKAYEPQVVAIGPYHGDKKNLKITEQVKLMYLRGILERRGEGSYVIERYIAAITNLEEKARTVYEGPIGIGKEDFVEMLLLDGCFVIEFLRKCCFKDWRDQNDTTFTEDWICIGVKRDLLLLENQLPFFVLVELFRMTTLGDSKDNIVSHVINSLDILSPDQCCMSGQEFLDQIKEDDVDHILGLTYTSWCSDIPSYNKSLEEDSEWDFIKSTTELEEAGIKLKKAESRCWLDIKFDRGVLEIPPLCIQEMTEDILRNLIAYEQHSPSFACEKAFIVSDYITFMDSLINTSKDVAKLCHYRIIDNWMGDSEKLATMFNNLGESVFIDGDDFLYSNIFIRINNHYGKRRNIWLANLRRNYFNTPWSVISFLAALILVIFTTLQTVYAILAYKQQ